MGGALEQEENKVLRAQLELTQVRAEIERRIAEKEDEFLSTKKNFQHAVDGLQNVLETESKAKAEAIRMKKKLEADVRDSLLGAQRRANTLQNALEESRTLLEQADRARRTTEQELSDTNEQLSELTCQNQSIAGAKRKLESEM